MKKALVILAFAWFCVLAFAQDKTDTSKIILPDSVTVEISIPVGQEIGCFVEGSKAQAIEKAIAISGDKSYVLTVLDIGDGGDFGAAYFFAKPPQAMGAGDYTVLAKYDGKWHEDCAARVR